MSGTRQKTQYSLALASRGRVISPASTFLPRLNSVEPLWYGPVCPMVWEGWRREASPYPDLQRVCDLLVSRLVDRLASQSRYSAIPWLKLDQRGTCSTPFCSKERVPPHPCLALV